MMDCVGYLREVGGDKLLDLAYDLGCEGLTPHQVGHRLRNDLKAHGLSTPALFVEAVALFVSTAVPYDCR